MTEKRTQTSFLAPLESRILRWLASQMPACVVSDHLTLLGFIAMILAGLTYLFTNHYPILLHIVNFCLFLNWFGDSLDGTLARYRNQQRPRFGFYVDHVIDMFGTFFLVGGLALSGYMSERIALALLITYLMLSINTYLATHAFGNFKLSFWKFSPTELRLLLGIGNLALLAHPQVQIATWTVLLYDLGAVISIILMSAALISSIVRNTTILYRLETQSAPRP